MAISTTELLPELGQQPATAAAPSAEAKATSMLSQQGAYGAVTNKIKGGWQRLKQVWLRLNGNDPEVAQSGLIALLLIAALAFSSYYVSFLDGLIRSLWFWLH